MGKKKAAAKGRGGMRVQLRATDSIRPYEGNPRVNDQAVGAVAASIREFGFRQPIVVDERGVIIAGHTRWKAAQELGLERVPVHVAAGLTKAQVRAYRIADNQTVALAEWDMDLLPIELKELEALDFDLSLLGFPEDELAGLLGRGSAEDLAGLDEVPDVPAVPVTRAGDLWLMGEHRLLCGDSTKAEDVDRVMGEGKAALMNTDPPYGVDYVAVKDGIPRSGFRDIQAREGTIENDDLTSGPELQAFLEKAIRTAVPHLTATPAFYLWHPMLTQGTFFAAAAAAAAAADILIHRQIIWVKPHLVLTRSGQYHWRHELCFYGWVRGHPCPWYGDKSQTSVWEVSHGEERGHPTQKPVELFTRPMLNHTKPGEACYEPFSGSGSQFIAAEHLGRVCYGLEIEPRYCDVALERWMNLTGKSPVREGDGAEYDGLKAKTDKKAAKAKRAGKKDGG